MKTFKTFLQENTEKGTIVHGIHYSNSANLTHLDPSKSGSGIKGAEQKRLPNSEDDRIKHRAYFYNTTGSELPKPETGLGEHIYKAELHKIYNPSTSSPKDKEEVALNKEKHMSMRNHPSNAFESGVLDSGYHGYTHNNMTVVLGKHQVPIKYHSKR